MGSSSPARITHLSILLSLFSRGYTGMALAIPTPSDGDFISSSHSARHQLPRAEENFVTMYGIYDGTSDSDASPDGQPKLAEVFLAMMTSSSLPDPPTGTMAISLASPQPTAPNSQSTPTTVTSPPKGGPGLVILSSTTLPGFATATSMNKAGTTNGAGTSVAATRTSTPSHRAAILGSVIGGILFLTLCLFFLLDPAVTSRLRNCCGIRKRFGKKRKEEKGISYTAGSCKVDATDPCSSKHTLTNDDVRLEKQEGTDLTLTRTHTNAVPVSKFSICSSEYLDTSQSSQRDSYVTSAYSNDTLKPMTMPSGSGNPPPRPPRPPTADSPALSDSVYLACSAKPYVIVLPQPLTDADMKAGVARQNTTRKLLTSTEFLALHSPKANASSNEAIRASSGTAKDRHVSFQPRTKRESQHSRTRSAPLLGLSLLTARMSTRSSTTVDPNSESENSTNGIVQRITKHRRSRSASGWAYPERPRARRFFNIESLR